MILINSLSEHKILSTYKVGDGAKADEIFLLATTGPILYNGILLRHPEEGTMKRSTFLLILTILLVSCGPAELPATPTPPPTETPIPTATPTPTPTPTLTPTPTPTPMPCSHVDLNGRYQDFREIGYLVYGWIMISEQNGCEMTASETFFLRANGPSKERNPRGLTGTIDPVENKMRICYTSPKYCLNLVIMDGGDTLANGVEGWYYEKVDE